jgi:aminoglycoside 3-N-acetyltransferase
VVQGIAERSFADELNYVIGGSDVVVAHSALWTFGHQFDGDIRRLPERLIAIMLEILGPKRSLAMPTYTFSFCSLRKFDLTRSKSEVGTLTEAFRKRTDVIRTLQPIYSYAILGPHAEAFASALALTAFGKGSAMSLFESLNVQQLMLGLKFQKAISIVHRAEELEGVPYRYYKRFSGDLLVDGEKAGEAEEIFYVRAWDTEPIFDYSGIAERLRVAGTYRASRIPDFTIEGALTKEILATASDMLRSDPYAFVKNRQPVQSWVAEGKANEIARLTADQRYGLYS